MDLKFTKDGLINIGNELANFGKIMMVSKSEEVKQAEFDNVVQIIDESGNEVNCTIDKFIEIFDTHGLEGFIL